MLTIASEVRDPLDYERQGRAVRGYIPPGSRIFQGCQSSNFSVYITTAKQGEKNLRRVLLSKLFIRNANRCNPPECLRRMDFATLASVSLTWRSTHCAKLSCATFARDSSHHNSTHDSAKTRPSTRLTRVFP